MASPAPNQMLGEMVTSLRAECGHSTNPAFGLNDRAAVVYLLNRTQLDLWENYDWPMLTVDRDVPLVPGQQYYSYPSDLRFEDITHTWVLGANQLYTLQYDITPADYWLFNSETGIQSWPPQKWRHNPDDGTFEVWPIPDRSALSTVLRLRGTQSPSALINDSDVATLPWRLIVLSAAAEILAKEEDPAAGGKAQRVSELIRRLRVRVNSHKGNVVSLGGPMGRNLPRVGLDYIPSGYGSGPRRR